MAAMAGAQARARTGWIAIYAAALFSVMAWAGTSIVTKVAVGAFDPVLIGILRSIVAGLAAAPFLIAGRVPRPRGAGSWGLLLLNAGSGFVLFPILFSVGQSLTTAGRSALVLASIPILTGLVALPVERRFPALRWWMGAAVALAGEALLITSRTLPGENGNRLGGLFAGLIGELLVLAGALGSAICYVAGSRLAARIGSPSTALWGNALAGLMMLPLLAVFAERGAWGEAGPAVVGSVLYLGIVASLVAYMAWYWALARGGVARMVPVQFTQPLFAVLFAIVLLGERLTRPMVVATLVILGGLYLTQRRITPGGAVA